MDICSVLPEEIILWYIFPYLTIVEIAECKLVSKRWLEVIRRYYGTLKELDMTPWDFMVTEDYLVNIIKHAKLLKCLRLSKCWRACTATSVFLVANTCSRLQVFNLSHCGSVTDQAVEEIARKCKVLKEVDLSSCYKISDSAMCSLAEHAHNLEELYVSSVYGVTDYGVSQLSFKGLKLKTLDVSYCFRVSNKGLVGILKRDQKTNLLKSLRIKGCAKVTDQFIQQLWEAGVEVNNMF